MPAILSPADSRPSGRVSEAAVEPASSIIAILNRKHWRKIFQWMDLLNNMILDDMGGGGGILASVTEKRHALKCDDIVDWDIVI